MASVEIPALSIMLGFFLSYLVLGAATNSAAPGSLVVTGNVFCDACLEGRPSQKGYVISGASVAVECSLNKKTMTVSITGETDENGEFKVELPSNIFLSADQFSKCSVKPLKSPDSFCRIPSKSPPASSLTLQSFSNGVLTYNAGSFSYRHETVPASCYSKGVSRMMRGRAVAENLDKNWKVGPQTHTNPSLQRSPFANAPFFQSDTPSFPKLPPETLFVSPRFPKSPPRPPFNRPRPGIPRFPKNPPGPPFNSPTTPRFPDTPPSSSFSTPPIPQPTPITPGISPQPNSDVFFGEPTTPSVPPQSLSDAPFGTQGLTSQNLEADLHASTTPSLEWSLRSFPPLPQPRSFPPLPQSDISSLPSLPNFPPFRPHALGFPKFPRGPPFNFSRSRPRGNPKTPGGPLFHIPPNPQPTTPDLPPQLPSDSPFGAATIPYFPPQPPSDAPFGTLGHASQNLEVGLQASTTPSLQWSSRSFAPLRQPSTSSFPPFPNFPPFRPHIRGFPEFPRRPPFNFSRPKPPGYPKTPRGPLFHIPPNPQPTTPNLPPQPPAPITLEFPPQPPSDAPLGTLGPASQNLEANLQASTTSSLQWSSLNFPPLQQPGTSKFPTFPNSPPSKRGSRGFPKFPRGPPLKFPRPGHPGFPKTPRGPPFDISPNPQPTTPDFPSQPPSNAPFSTPGPSSQ